MAEINEEIIKELMNSKINCYDSEEKYNFAIPTEITVTITLNEYRRLVKSNATARYDMDKLQEQVLDLKDEIKVLNDERATLQRMLNIAPKEPIKDDDSV